MPDAASEGMYEVTMPDMVSKVVMSESISKVMSEVLSGVTLSMVSDVRSESEVTTPGVNDERP
jgi:hypothetical protein